MEYVTLDKYLTKLIVTLLPGELYINQWKCCWENLLSHICYR